MDETDPLDWIFPMNDKSFGGRMLAFLSSLRLAVVTMVTLGAVCGYATFYEMHNGTPAAQRDIYQTPGFAFLLGLLGLNVFSVMVSRYPWTKHHTGFLIAHVGILLLLAGSVVSLYRGLDSNMALFEGETSDRVALLEKALQVSVPGLGVSGTFPVAFEKKPPAPGREKRFPLGGDVVLVADEYHPHVSVVEAFEPAAAGAPALHFLLQAPMATQEQWLVADDPQRSHLDLGMVSFGFHAALERRAGEGAPRPLGGREPPVVRGGAGRQAALRGRRRLGRGEDGRRRAGPAGPDRLAGDGRDRGPLPAAGAPRADGEARDPARQGGAPAVRGAAPPRGAEGEERARVGALGRARPRRLRRPAGEPRLPLARGRAALQGDAPQVQQRAVPGLAHGLDLREHGARRGPGEAASSRPSSR